MVIVAPDDDAGDPYLVGNTVLYGATGGELYVAGRAGERFAVRNSGATAVVEGAGQHACEYMTGGRVVILGPVGQNIGAGMTGGEAFVWDPGAGLPARVNPELVEARRLDEDDLSVLRPLLQRHWDLTSSRRARSILSRWPDGARDFWRVAPKQDVATIAQRTEGTLRKARA